MMLRVLKKLEARLSSAFKNAAEIVTGIILAVTNAFALTNEKEATPVQNSNGRVHQNYSDEEKALRGIDMAYA